jgi:uncharacterized protein (DUF488 family)
MTSAPSQTIWTIGHSTRPLAEFLDLLRAHRIGLLVDVRAIPYSRRYPHFHTETLGQASDAAGIAYRHLPGLGGRRRAQPASPHRGWKNLSFRGYADYMDSPEFSLALAELIRLAEHARTAIMCAEAVPWRCHRSLISDGLLVRGWAVLHILSGTKADPHQLPDWAHVEAGRLSYPGSPPPASLF